MQCITDLLKTGLVPIEALVSSVTGKDCSGGEKVCLMLGGLEEIDESLNFF